MPTTSLEGIRMAWVDRDRTPALFAIATSVTSSIISFVVGNVFLTMSKGALLAWVGAVFGVVAVVSFGAVYLVRRGRRRSQRAFFIVSAFDQKYYIAAFVQQLHNALDRANIDLVLKVPDRDYDAAAQSHHLERVLDRKGEYLGGVIFASEVRELHDDLLEFCRKSRLPVVFTDLEPFAAAEYPENSVYVGYDTRQLGELAGEWLAKHLRGVRRPRVLIVASREHRGRQEECKRVLERELKDVQVIVDDTCAFSRALSYDSVMNHVAKLESRRQCLHAIFCIDDEMALGAVDALATPSSATKDTVVIAVDGVAEARLLIDGGTSPFRATVVQNPHELALSVVDHLVKMHRGRRPPKRKILKPVIHEGGR